MRKWTTSGLVFLAMAVPTMAMPVIEFSPDPSNAGNWNYNSDTGILSFDQDVKVDQGVSSNSDALVGARSTCRPFRSVERGASTASLQSAHRRSRSPTPQEPRPI